MSRRRDLERTRDSLEEIRQIMVSMRTLAYLETHKLSDVLQAQRTMASSIAEVADDFFTFHPRPPQGDAAGRTVFVVAGSERGFCGDFNHALADRLAEEQRTAGDGQVITVGRKLNTLLLHEPSVVGFVEGASVAEEVPAVMQQLVHRIDELTMPEEGLTLMAIGHAEQDGIVARQLLPPFRDPFGPARSTANGPLLNVDEAIFLADLTEHYLFAALNRLLFESLMVENRRRAAQLEGASRHLEEETQSLSRQCRALRQEEIIEEIEVILLSRDRPRDEKSEIEE